MCGAVASVSCGPPTAKSDYTTTEQRWWSDSLDNGTKKLCNFVLLTAIPPLAPA